MKRGDKVRVYPHGSPDEAAVARVLVACERSIAIAFADKPPFVIWPRGGLTLMLSPYCIVMLATREELNGQPWGPWIELRDGGHYEIEELREVVSR